MRDFSRPGHFEPDEQARRERRIDWYEAFALFVIILVSFTAGVVLMARLTDGGLQ